MVSYEAIGKHILAARLRLGITQAEAAERAGISATYFGKIERGEIKPNIDRLADISQALRVPFESLFQGAMIPNGELLDNTPLPCEEFDEYIRAVGRKTDDRTRMIIMRICGELSNLSADPEE